MRFQVLKLVSNRLKPQPSISYVNNSCKCCLIQNSSLTGNRNHKETNKRKNFVHETELICQEIVDEKKVQELCIGCLKNWGNVNKKELKIVSHIVNINFEGWGKEDKEQNKKDKVNAEVQCVLGNEIDIMERFSNQVKCHSIEEFPNGTNLIKKDTSFQIGSAHDQLNQYQFNIFNEIQQIGQKGQNKIDFGQDGTFRQQDNSIKIKNESQQPPLAEPDQSLWRMLIIQAIAVQRVCV